MNSTELFASEFKKMMTDRERLFCGSDGFRLASLPIPVLNMPDFSTIGLDMPLVSVHGLKAEYFNKLNGVNCFLLPYHKLLTKRVYNADGSTRRGMDGKVMKTNVVIPRDSVAIMSTVSIKMKQEDMNNVSTKSLFYVDFIEGFIPDKRAYIYSIPKTNAFKVNTNNLVLSRNKKKSIYYAYKVALTNGAYVYLNVVSGEKKISDGDRLLGRKCSLDFNTEIASIVRYWVENGLAYDPDFVSCNMSGGIRLMLSAERFLGDMDMDDYETISSLSLAESGMEDKALASIYR